MNVAIIPVILAAALLAWLAWRVGQPLFRKSKNGPPQPPQMDKRAAFLTQMMATARQHLADILAAAGPEPTEILDEADTPPPHKQGRPRKNPPAPPPLVKQTVQTLVSGLKLPVQFHYAGALTPRQAVVISACGYIEPDGGYNVTMLRCICAEARAWRAFRLDRMTNLADLSTGEIIPDPKAWIMQLLNRMV